MRYLILFIVLISNLSSMDLIDIKKNKVEIDTNHSLVIFLGNFNCKDCIPKLGDFLKDNSVDSSRIYYVIETDKSIHSRLALMKMIQKGTDYYNQILFNPVSVDIKDTINSYYQKYTKNNNTPALGIFDKNHRYLKYKEIFGHDNSILIKKNELKSFVLEK